jgi:glycosyltransferase involved in cell wall biosynthesis
MKSKRYKLLIYIPSYNRYELLKKQTEMVLKQLRDDVCLIICDNASTDSRYSLFKDLQGNNNVFYYRNSVNIGIVGNILKGFTYNISDYLWILSDDEIIYDDSVEKILSTIVSKSCDHIYLKSNVKGEEELLFDNLSGWKNIYSTFSSMSMLGLISANVYNLNLCEKHIHVGYRFGHTLFPHVAIFLSVLSEMKSFNIVVVKNCVTYNYNEITYEDIHDECWRYYLDVLVLVPNELRNAFLRKFIQDWGATHYLKIMIRDKSLKRLLYYGLKYKILLPTLCYRLIEFNIIFLFRKLIMFLRKVKREL